MQFGKWKSNPSWISKASARVVALWKNPHWVVIKESQPVKVKIMKTSSQRSNGVTAMGRLRDKNIMERPSLVISTAEVDAAAARSAPPASAASPATVLAIV